MKTMSLPVSPVRRKNRSKAYHQDWMNYRIRSFVDRERRAWPRLAMLDSYHRMHMPPMLSHDEAVEYLRDLLEDEHGLKCVEHPDIGRSRPDLECTEGDAWLIEVEDSKSLNRSHTKQQARRMREACKRGFQSYIYLRDMGCYISLCPNQHNDEIFESLGIPACPTEIREKFLKQTQG